MSGLLLIVGIAEGKEVWEREGVYVYMSMFANNALLGGGVRVS